MTTPYSQYLGSRDPLVVLDETPKRIRELTTALGSDGLSHSYAPGKWTVCQILTHLAQVEMIFGTRLRQALTMKDYVVQPFDQDQWMAREPLPESAVVIDALCNMRQWNLKLFHSLSPAEQARTFLHPEQGTISVRWLIEVLAGHDLNHLAQLEIVAASVRH